MEVTCAGKDHGIAKWISPFFYAVVSLADPKKAQGLKCLQSLFLAKSQKGKQHSSGNEGFRNMIHSLLNGNSGNDLLCKGLVPVCELNLSRYIFVITQQDHVST